MNEFAVQIDCDGQPASATPLTPAQEVSRTELETALLAFAQFGAGAVHEINGPLAVSLLSAQLALRTVNADANPTVRRCLERAIAGIRSAAGAVRESIGNCSEGVTTNQQFDVRDVLRFATMLTRIRAEAHGCLFEWRISREESPVSGNPVELEIALVNCLFDIVSSGADAITLSSHADDSLITIQIEAHAGECTCLELLEHFVTRQYGTVFHRLLGDVCEITIRLHRSEQ